MSLVFGRIVASRTPILPLHKGILVYGALTRPSSSVDPGLSLHVRPEIVGSRPIRRLACTRKPLETQGIRVPPVSSRGGPQGNRWLRVRVPSPALRAGQAPHSSPSASATVRGSTASRAASTRGSRSRGPDGRPASWTRASDRAGPSRPPTRRGCSPTMVLKAMPPAMGEDYGL